MSHHTSEIILEPSNVLKIEENVPIIEERFKEGSVLKLTKDQITLELTNLLYTFYKHGLVTRIENYQQMLDPQSHSSSLFLFDTLKPVVTFKKLIHNPDDADNDEEYFKENNLQYLDLNTLVTQLVQIAKSSDDYASAQKRFNNLLIPFVPLKNDYDVIEKDTEAVNLGMQSIRVLHNDKLHIRGYYHEALNSSVPKAKNQNKYQTFDWSLYNNELSDLKTGEPVIVYAKNAVDKVNGEVVQVHDDHIKVKTKNGIVSSFDAFIYPRATQNFQYSFARLKDTNIYFANLGNKSHVMPKTLEELLIVLDTPTNVRNFYDLKTYINKFVDIDFNEIDKSQQQTLRKLLEVKYPSLVHAKPSQFKTNKHFDNFLNVTDNKQVDKIKGTFADSDIARYNCIHDDLSYENWLIVQLLEKYITSLNFKLKKANDADNIKNTLSKELNKIIFTPDTCETPKKELKIVKVYHSLQDLQADNGKKIYFDKMLDNSDYTIRQKFTSEAEIRDYIMSKNKNHGQSATEIDFEVKSILFGKRKVRVGDNCILSMGSGDVVYVRKNIENEHIWVKVARLPFRVCDNLLTIKEVESPSSCVFDTYANACKNIDNLRNNLRYNDIKAKLQILSELTNTITKYDEHLANVKKDKQHNATLMALQPPTDSFPFESIYNIHNKDDVDNYFDGDHTLPETMLDFNDQNNYAVLLQEGTKKQKEDLGNSPVIEFLATLIDFLDIELDIKDKKYILSMVDQEISHHNINTVLEKERNKLKKAMNIAKYQSNQEYRTAFDKLVAQKMSSLEDKLISALYFDIVVSTIAIVSLVIMSNYPNTVIQSIYPSCVRFMTYQGYPLVEKNVARSINKYICCVVKGITAGDNAKYGKVQDVSVDDLDTAVIKAIDTFMKKDTNLGLKVEANKQIINMKKIRIDDKKQKEFYGFKPSFEFNEANFKNKMAKYMYDLNSAVRTSTSLKVSATKMPLLMNACCLQQLSPSADYYNNVNTKTPTNYKYTEKPKNIFYFPSIKYKKHTVVNQSEIKFQNPKIIYSIHDAKRDVASAPDHQSINQNKIKQFIESNIVYQNDKAIKILIDSFDNNDVWNDGIFMKASQYFTAVTDFIKKQGIQSYDGTKIAIFKNIITNITNDSSIGYSMKKFMSNDLIKLSGKICNGVLVSGEDEENVDDTEKNLRVSFLRNKDVNIGIINKLHINALNNVNKLHFTSDNIKTVLLLNYIFSKYLYNVFINIVKSNSELIVYEDILSSSQVTHNTPVTTLVCEYILFLIYGMLDCINVNDENVNNIRKQVEELREKKKQDLISKYNIDDEERQLQMMLRKIGVDTWYDVGSSENMDQYVSEENNNAIDIMKNANQKEENENYNMKGYQGENGDADEVDEDFASMSMFTDV
jgi:hypothetical protein